MDCRDGIPVAVRVSVSSRHRSPGPGYFLSLRDPLMPPIHVEPGSVREFKNARRTGSRSGRKKKIATFAKMLKRGETIYPQGRK